MLFAELLEPASETEAVEPEDQRERVGGALTEIVGEVESFGGTVSAVSGTGVVALFGAPESHEDDPERALRAAIGAVASIHKRADGLSLRVGVESGPAFVGSIGGGSSHHYAALGDVVRIAGALQSQAGTASVLVGPATYRATEGIFDWGAAQEVAVYPGANPILANYVQRQKTRRQSEAGRRRLASAAPLVGREAELSAVREALNDATRGSGRVLAVIGEPGLGKTRLVQECRKLFTSWVGGVPGRLPLWLEARAASYGSTQPYGLYQQLLAAWLGIVPEDSERGSRAALERALRATYAGQLDADQTRLLSHVLGIGARSTAALISRLGPEKFQQACFSAVRELLGRIMGHGPTVVVLEDLHWADPTSLRLTETISSLTNEGPLLILVTRRPEPDRGTSTFEKALLSGGEGRLRLELSPLAEGSERELARALLGGGASEEIVSAISEGVDGNPLFMEERVTSLLETKALRRRDEGGWRLDLGAPGQVPEVLDRLVRSRVDRLDPAPREAVIAASVLGPEFSLRDLAPVTDLNGGLLPAVLELCSANLLLEQRQLSEPTYRFRHSLIQDAIYKGLLKQQRRHLHARAASGLEAASPVPEEIAGLLGRHYAMAGEVDRAVHYLELAGDAAAATYANDEAIASYRLALELFSEEPGLATEAVSLWLKLGTLFWRLGDYSEGRAALGEAAARSPAGAPLLEARCYRWLGQLEIEDCRDEDAFAALDKAEEVLQACSEKNSDDWVENWLDLQLSRSNLHYWRNETELQGQVLERARPVVEARAGPWKKADFAVHVAGNRWRARRFAVDDKTIEDVTAARQVVADAGLKIEEFHWHTLGSLLLLYGDLAKARTELEGALDAARQAGDKSLELANLVFLAWAHLRQHDVAGTEKIVQAGSELVRSRTFPSAGMVKALQSWVEWKLGRAAQAERAAIEALDQWRPNMVRYPFCAICLWPLIAVRLAEGRHAAAVEAASELLRPPQMRFPGELEADVALAISAWDNGDAPAAVQALKRALNLAQELRFA